VGAFVIDERQIRCRDRSPKSAACDKHGRWPWLTAMCVVSVQYNIGSLVSRCPKCMHFVLKTCKIGGNVGYQTSAQPRFQSCRVQFLGLGYCTEQNTDGIPSFVHCSLLRNGNHMHSSSQKLGGHPIFVEGVRTPLPTLQWLRPCYQISITVPGMSPDPVLREI